MIALDELLIKVGFDGSQAQQINGFIDLLQNGADKIAASAEAINSKLDSLLSDVSQSLDQTSDAASQVAQDLNKAGQSADQAESKFSKLKVGLAALIGGALLFGNSIASAFNAAIDNAEDLFKSKNALFSISKKEIDQANQYKQSLDKTSLAVDSIKTKIAINLIPSLTSVSEKFNNWLVINKDFISNGISKVILWLGRGMQVITNFIKFIDKVIRSTIGWKNAFIALSVAWAVLNRKFLMSPVGMLVAAFAGLLLLIDDLMVYLEGGESLFGSYWDPLISGTKSVINWFKTGEKIWKPILVGLGTYFTLLGATSAFTSLVGGIKSVGSAFKVLNLVMMTNPVLAIISALAALAYVVYDNWDWLSTQFKAIWSNISGFATAAWNSIISTISGAIKSILMYFGMSENGADEAVKKIGAVFLSVFNFIAAPFKAAYDFVTALFSIWGDDSTSVVDKFGKSFSLVKDLITSPFKKAMAWIQDKFMGFIDGILGTVKKALSYIGIEIDIGENKEIDYGGDEYRIKEPSSIQKSDLENIQGFASQFNEGKNSEKEKQLYDFARSIGVTENSTNNTSNVSNTNNISNVSSTSNVSNYSQAIAVPPPNSDNRVTNNNIDSKPTVNIYTTDTSNGIKKGVSSLDVEMDRISNNLAHRFAN